MNSVSITILLIKLLFVSHNGMTLRGGTPVYTFTELSTMKSRGDIDYLSTPFIISESSMKDWTLYESLYDVFDEDYQIKVKTQTANCSSCFGFGTKEYEICKEFVSTFLYSRDENPSLQYWDSLEMKSSEFQKYKECMTHHDEFHNVNELYSLLNEMKESQTDLSEAAAYDNQFNNDSAGYTYWRIVELADLDNFNLDLYSLNVLDHVHLTPFLRLFSMPNLNSVESVHIWFGKQKYRAIRHFDKPNNLFFMISGSKKFMLSPPTSSVFLQNPYAHRSSRQQYPNYLTLLETNENEKQCDFSQSKHSGVNVYEYAAHKEDTTTHTSATEVDKDSDYEVWEAELRENEVLYLPSYWYHEVVNDNFSCAFNVWYKSNYQSEVSQISDFHLPMNPGKKTQTLEEFDEFVYFLYRVSEQWCSVVRDMQITDRVMRCKDSNYSGHGFLFTHFVQIYPILNELTFDKFVWTANVDIDVDSMFKCAINKMDYYGDFAHNNFGDLLFWRDEAYFCYEINEKFRGEWDNAVTDIIDMHLEIDDIAIAEMQLVEYMEHMIQDMVGDSNLIPTIIGVYRF